MAIIAYYLTLLAWIAFLPAALAGRSSSRAWAVAAVVCGAVALARDLWHTVGSGPSLGSIRLDIPLIIVALGALYLASATRLWLGGSRTVALVGGGIAALAIVGLSVAWTRAMAEGRAGLQNYEAGNRLLFDARFRNEETYRRVFEMEGSDLGFPVGHWVPSGTAGRTTRLVINPAGWIVEYFDCRGAECPYGPGAQLSQAGGEEAAWEAVLVNPGVGETRLELVSTGVGRLDLIVGERSYPLELTPPPLRGEPDGTGLTPLGSFTGLAPDRQHVRVAQVWLWRDPEGVLGVGIFEILVAGRRADYVSPVLLGRGTAVGDAYRFEWEQRGRTRSAHATIGDAGVELAFVDDEAGWGDMILRPRALFRDDVMELAPLDGVERWQHWFSVLLTHHFSSAEIPGNEGDVPPDA